MNVGSSTFASPLPPPSLSFSLRNHAPSSLCRKTKRAAAAGERPASRRERGGEEGESRGISGERERREREGEGKERVERERGGRVRVEG